MSDSNILLEVVTPERLLISQPVQMVMAVGTEGAMGILPGHVPLLAALKISELRWLVEDHEQKAAISGGFMEVTPAKVSILVESAELATDIDEERTIQAKRRAEERLQRAKDGAPDIDIVRAERALQKSITRLKVLK